MSLLSQLDSVPDGLQVWWYADDAAATGRLAKDDNDGIKLTNPDQNYFGNGEKTWLVVKEECFQVAVEAFSGTSVQITIKRRPHLGAPIGSSSCKEFMSSNEFQV